MATAVVKQGTKDLCIWCSEPIIYGCWEFWKDDHLLVPEGPKSPGWVYENERTEKWKEETQAFENWRAHRNARGVINQLGQEWHYTQETWIHLVSFPIEKFEDVSYMCGKKDKQVRPAPASWCTKMTNENGVCHRKAKEVLTDRYGRKQALCGIHLAHARRDQKEAEQYEQERELSAWRRDRNDELIRELAKYGVIADQEFVTMSGTRGSYSGKVVVDPEKLLEILEENVEVFDAPSDS